MVAPGQHFMKKADGIFLPEEERLFTGILARFTRLLYIRIIAFRDDAHKAEL